MGRPEPTSLLGLIRHHWAQIQPNGRVIEGSFRSLPSGYEAAIYGMDAVDGGGRLVPLILKHYGGVQIAEAVDGRARREFDTLRALGGHYPVPTVFGLVPSGGSVPSGTCLVMESVGSQGLWDALSQGDGMRRAALVRGFAALMRELHDMDPTPLPIWRPAFDTTDPYACQTAALGYARAALQARPRWHEWRPVIDWLDAHRMSVPCPRYALVHNDFHPANVRVDDEGRLYVIDWTSAQIDDPRSELGWTYATMICHPDFNRIFMEAYGPQGEMDYFLVGGTLKKIYAMTQPFLDGNADDLLPHARAHMLTCGGQVSACYRLLHELTGVELPSVGAFLAMCTQ